MKSETSPDGLTISPALLAELEAVAGEEHRPIGDLVREALERYVAQSHRAAGAQPLPAARRRTPAEAGARIRELRKGRSLPEGETIRSLIDAGRR
jgi:hypothetical protein